MTYAEMLSKYEYHSALATEAARNCNWADMDIEDARAELCLWHLLRA